MSPAFPNVDNLPLPALNIPPYLTAIKGVKVNYPGDKAGAIAAFNRATRKATARRQVVEWRSLTDV
ncbi:hypothetical protein MMC30_006208 [Trapelia coarctata]|nr:hypothetical protein [Trapelia coarctata]